MADTSPMARSRSAMATGSRTTLQKAAMLVAVVFVLVGILGFIPFANQDFDQMTLPA